MAQKHGNKYGTHRVIEPKGVLPQPANKLDNNMDEIWDNEILIDVQTLNIDSASFTDIHNYAKQQAGEGASEEKVMEEVKKEMFLNVELQGKHRNRRTGSGGMLQPLADSASHRRDPRYPSRCGSGGYQR